MIKFIMLIILMVGSLGLSFLNLRASKAEDRTIIIAALERMHFLHLSALD